MKLNYKRTLFVGFAFFLICMFWQAYDTIIPLILTNKFGLSQTWSGVIMALDNILALFLLPLFGSLSDKCRSKWGKRTPFITIGTVLAAVFFILLSVTDAKQLTKIENVTPDRYESSLSVIYDADPMISVPKSEEDGKSFTEAVKKIFSSDEKQALSSIMTREEFLEIKMYETDENGEATATVTEGYTNYVVPARNAYAWQMTAESPVTMIFFIVLLLLVLISMGTFRSPAVALMPDVTVKPLRSKANAIINLMGAFGGIIVLVLGMVFKTGSADNALMSYTVFFSIVAGIMIVSLAVFLFTVREPQWCRDMEEESRKLGIDESEDEDTGKGGKLSKGELRSLIFILASVALWYMGYNAVSSKYSVYAGAVLNMDYNATLIIAQAAAIVSYIPVGIISSKFGRKKTIIAGVIILAAAFFCCGLLRAGDSPLVMNILFSLAGIGWATINVNSYPMVVELAKNGNVGKYTGYYYTASMAAQVITPILSGVFLDIRFTTLFPYATIFVGLAFLTMLFVKHGDSNPEPKKSALEHLDVDM